MQLKSMLALTDVDAYYEHIVYLLQALKPLNNLNQIWTFGTIPYGPLCHEKGITWK